MRRCPECAESVQGAALVCRFCGHRFAAADPVGTADDHVRAAAKWIVQAAIALVLFYFAYACVQGAAIDQAQRPAQTAVH